MFQLNSVLITNCWEIQLGIFLQKNLYKSFPILHFRGFIINKVYFLMNFRLALRGKMAFILVLWSRIIHFISFLLLYLVYLKVFVLVDPWFLWYFFEQKIIMSQPVTAVESALLSVPFWKLGFRIFQ